MPGGFNIGGFRISRTLFPYPGAAFSGLLDQFGGAACAYSLRNLRAEWSGQDVILARRSSDNAELGFTATEVTDGTLATWAGAGDAFVKTWYDQSGISRDGTQTTAINQPQIVSSGSLLVDASGKPRIAFNASHWLNVPFTTAIPQPYHFFSVNKRDSSSEFRYLFDASRSTNRVILGRTNAGGFRIFAGTVVDGGTYPTTQIVRSDLLNGASSVIRSNGASALTGNAGANPLDGGASFPYRIGSDPTGLNNGWIGDISEMVLYPSDQTSNQAAIEANINDYYSIY